LFSCSDTTTCQEVTDAGYYVNEGTKELYTCTGASGSCSSVDLSSVTGNVKANYIDNTKALITCTSTDCTLNTPSDGIYLDASSATPAGKYTKLIICKEGKCSSEDAYGPNILLDYSSKNSKGNYDQLIQCVEGGGSGDSGSGSGSSSSSSNGSNSGSRNGNNNGSLSGSQSSIGSGVDTCKVMSHGATAQKVTHYITDIEDITDKIGDRLITCTFGEGCFIEDTTVEGYFINSDPDDDMIIRCEIDEEEVYDCYLVDSNLVNECENVGDIMVTNESGNSKAFFCITEEEKDSKEIHLNTEIDDEYIFITVDDKIFPGVTTGGKICVKISGEGSVVKTSNNYCTGEVIKECEVSNGSNCIVDSYYLINPTKNTIINKGTGELFYCAVENEACTKIVNTGIYIEDKDNIYSCQQDTCSKSGYETACSDSTTGRIIYDDKNASLFICVSNGVAIELSLNNNGNYVVAGSAGNIFTTSGYAIIKIDGQVITLDPKYKNNSKYIYVNTSDNGKYKIMDSKDSCPKKENAIDSTNVLELKCNNGICQ